MAKQSQFHCHQDYVEVGMVSTQLINYAKYILNYGVLII